MEVLHIQAGGIAPPGFALAATGFALFAILPWLNFSVLPRFGSLRSLLGNAAVVVLLGVLVPLLTRLPRTLLGVIAVLVIGVNVRTLGGAGGGGPAGKV